MNIDLLNILVMYLAVFGVVFLTVLGIAFSRHKWVYYAQSAQAWSKRVDAKQLVKWVDEPDDPAILYGVKFAEAINLRMTPEQVSAAMPDLIESFVRGLQRSEEITQHVQSKLD